MRKRLVLPIETINILKQFGDIDTVVNKILDLAEQEELPIYDINCDAISNYQCNKITVNITNTWFIELLTNTNVHPKPSIAKFLQYFVENELFDNYELTAITELATTEITAIRQAQNYLSIAANHWKCHDEIILIINELNSIAKRLQNEYTVSN